MYVRSYIFRKSGKNPCLLAMLLLSLYILPGCSMFSTKPAPPPNYAEDAMKARKDGPLEGDVRVIDGEEYVYGKNVKYMTSPYEPMFQWMPRHVYIPTWSDTFPGHVGTPAVEDKDLRKLEQRVAELEQKTGRKSPQKASPSKEPARDGTGRVWTIYFQNDDGVQWFMDEGTRKPTRYGFEVWRKRVFPPWAMQREIVTLDEINCREERYRTRTLMATDRDGSTQRSDKVTPWANAYSYSPDFFLMSQYCN